MNKRIVPIGIALAIGGVVLARCSGSGGSTSPPTPPESRLPAAPSNLVATPVSPSEIVLTWQDNSNNEDGFVIQRCGAEWGEEEGCPPGKFIGGLVVATNERSYRDQGIPWSLYAGDTYGYRVYARNAAGSSEFSNVAMATVPVSGPLPTAPTEMGAGSLDGDSVTICGQLGCYGATIWNFDLWWRDNSDNEDAFLIEECWGVECTTFTRWYHDPANSTVHHFGPGLATCGTAWTWRVRAHSAGGYSDPSNSVTVNTLDDPICAPDRSEVAR